jgi:hypothetical protein
MRKLIVSNFVTLDGYYEDKNKSINSLFDYYHADYSGDNNFDYYNVERARAADFLLLLLWILGDTSEHFKEHRKTIQKGIA